MAPLFLASCAPSKLFGSTLTPTPSITQSPTSTLTPTPSPTLTIASSPTPTATLHLPVLIGTPIPRSGIEITSLNINRIVHLATWGLGDTLDEVVSPDGQTLAIGMTGGVALYDIRTFEQKDFITTDYYVERLAYSTDGKMLAIGEMDGALSLLDMTEEKYILRRIGDPNSNIRSKDSLPHFALLFSPDGRYLLQVLYDKARVWQVQDGKLLLSDIPIDNKWLAMSQWDIPVTFFPDGSALVIGSEGRVKFLDIQTGNLAGELLVSNVGKIGFSHDGRFLAMARDSIVSIYEKDAGNNWNALVETLAGSDFVFSPDDGMLAIDSRDGVIRLWAFNSDGTKLTKILTLNGYAPLVFSPNNDLLAVSAKKQWFLEGNQHDSKYAGRENVLLYQLADGTLHSTIQVISPDDDTWKRESSEYGYHPTIFGLHFSVDGSSLFSIASWYTRYVKLVFRSWNITDGGSLQGTIQLAYPQNLMALAFASDGSRLAAGWGWGDQFPVTVRDTRNGGLIQNLVNTSGHPIDHLEFDPSGSGRYLFASHSYPGYDQHFFWDLTTTKILDYEPFVPAWNQCVSPDWSIVCYTSDSGYQGIYFTRRDGSHLLKFNYYLGFFFSGVTFSPNGTMIAIGYPGSIQIWGIPPDK